MSRLGQFTDSELVNELKIRGEWIITSSDERGSGPIATRHPDGSVTLAWPDGKPGVFDMSTTTFELMIEDANAERALADDANILLDRLWNQMPDPFPDQAEWGGDVEAWQARYQETRQR